MCLGVDDDQILLVDEDRERREVSEGGRRRHDGVAAEHVAESSLQFRVVGERGVDGRGGVGDAVPLDGGGGRLAEAVVEAEAEVRTDAEADDTPTVDGEVGPVELLVLDADPDDARIHPATGAALVGRLESPAAQAAIALHGAPFRTSAFITFQPKGAWAFETPLVGRQRTGRPSTKDETLSGCRAYPAASRSPALPDRRTWRGPAGPLHRVRGRVRRRPRAPRRSRPGCRRCARSRPRGARSRR